MQEGKTEERRGDENKYLFYHYFPLPRLTWVTTVKNGKRVNTAIGSVQFTNTDTHTHIPTHHHKTNNS